MIDLRRLRYFVAVAEEEHFGRAAARLGISQPPLSEHIKQLEDALDAKLLYRTTRSVRLTTQGEALLKHAKSILQDTDRCREIVQMAGQKSRKTFTLGLLHAHAYTFVPQLLRDYLNTYPELRINLVEYSTVEQVGRLLDGTIDVGLIREPAYHPSLRTQHLFSEPYIVALPQDWEISRQDVVSVHDLARKPMIDFPSHDHRRSTQSLFRDYFHQHRVVIGERLEVRTMHAALALVAASRGFAPVPHSQSKLRLHGVTYRPLSEPPPELAVGIAWREDIHSETALAFMRYCSNYFKT